MTGKIVNLRMFRKRRQRDAERAAADATAARHGRTLTERAADEADADRARRLLDGHRLGSEGDADSNE